jgi:hypothetical protein
VDKNYELVIMRKAKIPAGVFLSETIRGSWSPEPGHFAVRIRCVAWPRMRLALVDCYETTSLDRLTTTFRITLPALGLGGCMFLLPLHRPLVSDAGPQSEDKKGFDMYRSPPQLACAAIAAILLFLTPLSCAYAYVGPGLGLSAIGAVFAFLAAIFLTIVGFIWYPIKKLMRKLQAKTNKTSQTQPR